MTATSIVLKDFWMYWCNALDTGRDASCLLCGMQCAARATGGAHLASIAWFTLAKTEGGR